MDIRIAYKRNQSIRETIHLCVYKGVLVWILWLWRKTMTKATLKGKLFFGADESFRGSVHYHHGRTHDNIKQPWCCRIQKFYILIWREQKKTGSHSGWTLSIRDLTVHPIQWHTSLIRLYLLVVPPFLGQAFRHMSLWGQTYSNHHKRQI